MEMQKNDETSEALDDLFVAFVHAALPLLNQWITAGELWGDSYLRGDFEENAYYRTSDHVPAFGGLLQKHLSDLLALEETQRCVEKHMQAGVLPVSTGGTDEAVQPAVLDLLVPFVESCKQQDELPLADLTNGQILEQYYRCRTAWEDADSRFTITFPLINFSSDISQSKQLSPHLSLAPLTPADKTTLWNDDAKLFTFSTPPLDATTFLHLTWKLVGTFSAQKKEDASDVSNTRQEALDELGDIMTAMHLLKGGDAGAPAIYQKRLAPVLWEGTRMCYPLNQVRQFPSSRFSAYELHESDIAPLQELVKALQQLRLAQPRGTSAVYGDLSVGLRRFNQSYERRLPEDQIIDLTIALESTLLADHDDELTYRLAVRGAALLADAGTSWRPRRSRALLTAMYAVRSSIVHSGQLLSDQKILNKIRSIEMESKDFPQQCEQIVRDVLTAYVQRRAPNQSVKQINKSLEERIADGLEAQMSSVDVLDPS
ncbi:MAG TPA: hypothetical protein VFV38_21555 [Ktedonobacteraceae bacterium]|nr:hypothetical protein [Ktedonobacteraceae bacterium]